MSRPPTGTLPGPGPTEAQGLLGVTPGSSVGSDSVMGRVSGFDNVGNPDKFVKIGPFQQIISSCTGALITSFIVTPLDVVKIRLQAQQQPFKQGSCFIYCNGLMDCLCMCSHCNGEGSKPSRVTLKTTGNWYNRPGHFNGTLQQCDLHGPPTNCAKTAHAAAAGHSSSGLGNHGNGASVRHFNGTLDAFVKIARYEGLSSLWSGLPPTLVMSIPATVFYFTTYDHLKYYMGYRENDKHTRFVPLLAGSTARVGTVILISPLELIRTKMQSEQLSYQDLRQALRVSVRHGGMLSMMRGVGPSLLRDVPFSAIYWFGYEYVKALQLSYHGNSEVTFSQSMVAGGTAGSVAGLLTLPFDVVKTQRQIQLGQAQQLRDTKLVPTYTLIAQIYRQKGFSALFAGWVPRLVKVAPACAIMISTYEYFKTYFRKQNLFISGGTPAVKSWV